MTVSTPRVQPGLPSLTPTLSSRDWEQCNPQPNLHAVVRPYRTPMRSHHVFVDVVMHNDDSVPLTLPLYGSLVPVRARIIHSDSEHCRRTNARIPVSDELFHGSNVNSSVYLSKFKELDRNSRFGYDAAHLVFAHSNHMDSFLSQYAHVHRGHRFPKEFNRVVAKYKARMEYLRVLGAQDDIGLNELSKRDFFLFIDSAPYLYVASLVLTDNGNIQALWKLGDDDRIGIHFRGNGMASYVIFKRMSESDVSREFGLTSLDGVRTEIQQFGFEEELKRWPTRS